MNYWLHPDLPDENVMLAERHWDILNRVVPAYNSFVQLGSNVNRKLKIKFDVSSSYLLAVDGFASRYRLSSFS